MAGVARWTSADPKGIADGFNIFAYAKANPIAFTDPSGTSGDPPPKGSRTRIVYNYGDAAKYRINGVYPDASASLGSNVAQSHVVGIDIWKWLTGGVYNRNASATGKFTYQGQSFNLGQEYIILNPPLLERMIGKHMAPVVASLKSGNIDNVDGLLASIKGAYKAAHAEYDAHIKANPGAMSIALHSLCSVCSEFLIGSSTQPVSVFSRTSFVSASCAMLQNLLLPAVCACGTAEHRAQSQCVR